MFVDFPCSMFGASCNDKGNDLFSNARQSTTHALPIWIERRVRLYVEIIRDVYRVGEGDKHDKIDELNNKKVEWTTKLDSAEDKYMEEKIDDDAYQRLNKRYKEKFSEIDQEILELESMDSNFDTYVKEGLPLLTNLSKRYLDLPVRYKKRIIGSIFPEKLIFDGTKYRTTRVNEVLSLMSSVTNKYKGVKKERPPKTAVSLVALP